MPDIFVTLKALHSNPMLLNNLLNENLLKQYSDARKITELGYPLPWLKKDLKEVLNKTFNQKLNGLTIDFEDNIDEEGPQEKTQTDEYKTTFRR